MAPSTLTVLLLAAAVAVTFSSGASTAPSPAPTCQDLEVENLSGCLPYVEKGSNLTTPDGDCCRGFKSLVDSRPLCLCELLAKGSPVHGIDIDRSRAVNLPGACKVQTPPVSLCSAVGVPVSAPSPSTGTELLRRRATGASVAPPADSAVCLSLGATELARCLTYAQRGSNETRPAKECCTGLDTVVRTQPRCLCGIFGKSGGAPIPGVDIDAARATNIPNACNVQKPPASLCYASQAPAASAGSSPSLTSTPSSSAVNYGARTRVLVAYLSLLALSFL